jgi:Skp family chaperone for outer membrane proteins
VATRRRIVFTLCIMGLVAVALALPAGAPGLSRGEERAREQQINDLEKQLLDLNGKLNELKKETPKAAPALPEQPKTKVAVMNLSYIIKNYKKWEAFQNDYKTKLESFEKELRPLKDQYEEFEKELKKPGVDADKREEIGKSMRDTQRTLQNLTEDYKKVLKDFEGKSFKTIYNDVNNMAERYAKAHGFELVMHFNDGTTEDEANTDANVGRKMGLGALFPVYVTPGMDISIEVIALLNKEIAPAPEKDE